MMNHPPRNFSSIQELLIAHGYEEGQKEGCFKKDSVKIPFSEIAGHSVATFAEKARHRGWIEEEQPGSSTGQTSAGPGPAGVPLWHGMASHYDEKPPDAFRKAVLEALNDENDEEEKLWK